MWHKRCLLERREGSLPPHKHTQRNIKNTAQVLCWKDEKEVYLLTNMHNPPASGHFVEEEENTSKPLCTESYNKVYGF